MWGAGGGRGGGCETYILAVVSGYFLPSGGRQCVHAKKMKFIHRKKQLILISIEKQRWQITHTQTHTYTLKESVYEREGRSGGLEES